MHLNVRPLGGPTASWQPRVRRWPLAGDFAWSCAASHSCVYLHSGIDGFSNETVWGYERLLGQSAGVLLRPRISRMMTGTGSNYRAKDVHRTVLGTAACRQRVRPHTPQGKGKVERHIALWPNGFFTPQDGPQKPNGSAARIGDT